MLRSLRRPPPWPLTGYVCRSCRHQLQSTRRFQATAAVSNEVVGEDDGYSNFNDLSTSLKEKTKGKRDRDGKVPSAVSADDQPRARSYDRHSSAVNALENEPSAALERQIQCAQARIESVQGGQVAFATQMNVMSLRGEIALRKRVLELRRNGKLPEPVKGVRTLDMKRLASHSSIMGFKEVSLRILKERRAKLHVQLQGIRPARSDPSVDGSNAIPDRNTAFVRKPGGTEPAAAGRKLRAKVALYDRVIELREQEPDEEKLRSHATASPNEIIDLAQRLKNELDSGNVVEVTAPVSTSTRDDGPQQRDAHADNVAEPWRQHTKSFAPVPDESAAASKQTGGPGAAQLEAVTVSLGSELQTQTEPHSSASGTVDSLEQTSRTERKADTSMENAEIVVPSESSVEPLQDSADSEESEAVSIPRIPMPTFAAARDDDYTALLRGGSEPSNAEKVRMARDRPKWGAAMSSSEAMPAVTSRSSVRSKPRERQDATTTALFADSPADLAEMQAKTSKFQAASTLKFGQALGAEGQTLDKLKESLQSAIKNKNDPALEGQILDDKRRNVIEQNIRDYERNAGSNTPEDRWTTTKDASGSLAKLHRVSNTGVEEGLSASEKGGKPESALGKPGKTEPAKPAQKRGRKSRRNLRIEKERATAARPSAHAQGSSAATGNDEEDGHKPLWKVRQELATSTAAANVSKDTESPDLPSEHSDGPPPLAEQIEAANLHIAPLDIPQPTVPGLEYGLDKVLFNPGVYQLQDPTSRVYNFDPYLQHIMPAMEFDFNALKEYKTSSEDRALSAIAKEHQKRYIGSTSSMTSTLAHFHYLLSSWRPLNLDMLSRGLPDHADEFTKINRAPNAIFLRWDPKSKTYAIDADKEFDGANVLMMLGKSMEKMLTLPRSDFEKYRKSDPREVSDEMRNEPEAFQYTTMGDFLMRSQLDAYDSRLPGTGTFDLKTRAVLSVRMDAEDFEPMLGYEIHTLQGRWNSYEREYYDMIRSTMLKYMLQARMGRMQGIFAAYHNIERIFGFQYIPMLEMDRAIHGQIDPCLGDQEFRVSLELLNKVLDKATAKFPEKSLRFHFEATSAAIGGGNPTPILWVFAEPMEEQEIKRIQSLSKEKVREFERNVMGIEDSSRSPAPQQSAADSTESEDQAPTEYPPATPEPMSNEPEDAEPEPQEDSVPTTYPPATPKPPSSSSSNPEFSSSSSAADSDFLSSLSPSSHTASSGSGSGSTPTSRSRSGSGSDANPHLAPLFAASILIKSKVNGQHVERPSKLQRDDNWTVEYMLHEYPTSETMWARYVATKARRKEVLVRERDDDEDVAMSADGGKRGKKSDGFIEFLRENARRGREFRKEMNAAEKGLEKKFAWKVADGATNERVAVKAGAAGQVDVEDVGGYMGWLYGERGRKE